MEIQIKGKTVQIYGGTLKKINGDKLTFEIGKVLGEPDLEILDLKEIEVQVSNDFWEELLGFNVGIIKGKGPKTIVQLCSNKEL